MKESEFIEQNKKKWLEFENSLEENIPDPAKTTKLFVQITDDLSYARTFYKNRSVRLYLNAIARVLFNDLNKAGHEKSNRFVNFWKTDLPLTLFGARRAMLISLRVFVASFTVGVLSSRHDTTFAASILSSDYIHMTDENIKKGDAMAVYKQKSEVETFLPILLNNLKVDLLTFFSGLIMSLGSLVVMVSNGVMVGVFQYYFITKGLFWESFLGIWTHGSLEIPTIILSGGAGLTLGKGLLFPGTYSRFQAFKISALQGLKIVLGVAPLTLLAAFVEGFITRHTDFPDAIRLTFIIVSFLLVISYYYIYPRRVAKKANNELNMIDDSTLAFKEEIKFDASVILSAPEIITQSFRFLFQNFSKYSRFIFGLPLILAALATANPATLFHPIDQFSTSKQEMLNFSDYPVAALLALFTLATVIYAVTKIVGDQIANKKTSLFKNIHLKSAISSTVTSLSFCLLVYSDLDYIVLICCILMPVLLFVCATSYINDLNFYEACGTSFSLLGQSFGRFAGSAILFILLGLLINGFASYALRLFFIDDAIMWALTDNGELVKEINYGLQIFQTYFSFFLIIVLTAISNVILLLSLNEISTAGNLTEKIKKIGLAK